MEPDPIARLALSRDPIDASVIAGLRDLDDGAGELLGELIGLFITDTPPRLRALRQSLETRDGAGLARAAHALKSSAGNLGARNMATLCQRLEGLGRSGDLAGAGPLLERLEEEFTVARTVLASQRSSQT